MRPRLVVQTRSVRRHEATHPHDAGSDVAEDALEPRAADNEGERPHVLRTFPQDIECDQPGRAGREPTRLVFAPREVDAALELLKSHGLAGVIEGYDLAVQDDGRLQLSPDLLKGMGDLGKL